MIILLRHNFLFYDVWPSKICIFVMLAFISNIGKIRLETQKYTWEKVVLKIKRWPLVIFNNLWGLTSFDKKLHFYNVSIHFFTSEIIWKKKHLRQVFRNIIAFRSFSVLKIHKDYCVVENWTLRSQQNLIEIELF